MLFLVPGSPSWEMRQLPGYIQSMVLGRALRTGFSHTLLGLLGSEDVPWEWPGHR